MTLLCRTNHYVIIEKLNDQCITIVELFLSFLVDDDYHAMKNNRTSL